MPAHPLSHSYRIVLPEDGAGVARTIEFEAAGAESALFLARQQCPARQAELFEDGRSLGTIQCVPAGFWVLSAPRPVIGEPPLSATP